MNFVCRFIGNSGLIKLGFQLFMIQIAFQLLEEDGRA